MASRLILGSGNHLSIGGRSNLTGSRRVVSSILADFSVGRRLWRFKANSTASLPEICWLKISAGGKGTPSWKERWLK